MISSFARAAQIFDDAIYLQTATRAAEFVRMNYSTLSTRLSREIFGRAGAAMASADDYAFVIQGLLDLYEAAFDLQWLTFANELEEVLDALFWDDAHGAYFSVTGTDANGLCE